METIAQLFASAEVFISEKKYQTRHPILQLAKAGGKSVSKSA